MGQNVQSVGRLIIAAAILLSGSVASAQSSKQRALEHYRQAEAYLKVKAYENAIEEYQAAYKLVAKPGFLFNIGLAYEAAGDDQQALAYYQRYLKKKPRGRASIEARARSAALTNRITAAEKVAASEKAKQAEQAQRAARARERVAIGESHEAAKEYKKAIAQYRAALELLSDADYVYRVAEAYRKLGDRAQAIVEYERYRELAPSGPHAGDAIQKITKLRRELDEAARPKPAPVQPPKIVETQVEAPPVVKKKKKRGRRWLWLSIGVAAIAAGVATDVVPSSASNGDWDVADFVPLGLYGVGGAFVLSGVF